ncbi:MAG: hypothetical protein U0Q16_28205 [Bryobacteraceae bacterium]
MRYRLYLDESGDHSSNHETDVNKRHLGLVGVVFEFERHPEFGQRLEGFKAAAIPGYDPDTSPILRREDIVGKRRSNT